MISETLEQKLQNKINFGYNNFISELDTCDWSLITANKNNQLLEKNRSVWCLDDFVKNNTSIKNWINRIKTFCLPVEKKNNNLLNNNALENSVQKIKQMITLKEYTHFLWRKSEFFGRISEHM